MQFKISFFLIFLPALLFGQLSDLLLDYKTANDLSQVPLDCIHQEYPNKLNQVLTDSSHLQSPQELHPVFYGCFDWHSSVHGHWLLARMMNKFPDTDLSKKIVKLFDEQLQVPKVQKELAYFQPALNKSFERTYGWAWILQLYTELHESPLNAEHKWTDNLQSLINEIVGSYKAFLPKLVYPIRVGEHNNTAFGLSLALDYARVVGDKEFENAIISRSKHFYMDDKACPVGWEPSGFDFISPCLQEAELMSKVLESKEFINWMKDFLPQVFEKDFALEPGQVIDRTDGKLVHLDGLNFSRAWCLYGIASKLPKQSSQLISIGDQHLKASMDQVIGSNYMGSHWLASFLVYALEKKELASVQE
jgi:hypothetical protein